MHDVVTSTLADEVPEYPETERERREKLTPATCIESHLWGNRDDANARKIRLFRRVPLAHCQIGDVVPILGEPEGKVAVPTFRTPDGVRVETVVDDADLHALGNL